MRRISETAYRLEYIEGATDPHGNPVDGWGDPEPVGIYGFDPGSSSEPREGSNRVTVDPTLYGPYGMPFNYQDKCVVHGATYQVLGVTRRWRHPNGREPGAVVSLSRVEG